MRSRFQYELSGLTAQLAQMCVMAGQAMDDATFALLQADIGVADGVIRRHEDISAMGSSAEETAFLLLTSQARMAADLRSVVSALHITADAERMGELAVRVAEIARRRHPGHAVADQVSGPVADMGSLAAAQARTAQEALLSGEPRTPVHALHDHGVMKELHRRLLIALIDKGRTGVDVALLGCLYERFSDHAVHIARHVISRHPAHYERPALSG
ncbi:phosphate-specific transport system accessory protein PhoU [Mycobacterium sp. MFM001]|uniref:phosphate signaling complex PhoU family protein n=1 Tax=Mycobacterium sp. MFM001 TaxID=2049453 RepID=UPI000DA5D1B3|nr:PhoU domain-containing protein [Mycobacterium sp. MFM001]GBE66477.1 phosphate-specific transport system accessory protein PhoU [Mycobacterium sp. MFM001]